MEGKKRPQGGPRAGATAGVASVHVQCVPEDSHGVVIERQSGDAVRLGPGRVVEAHKSLDFTALGVNETTRTLKTLSKHLMLSSSVVDLSGILINYIPKADKFKSVP